MKRRKVEHVEKRRPLVELNLLADPKGNRLSAGRKGCLSFLTPILIGVVALVIVVSGLH
jgi:hypothetical protein